MAKRTVKILKKRKNMKNVPRMEAKSKDTRPFTKCSSCKKRVYYGDYPFCPHGPVRSVMAQRFSPIVVFRAKDGSYRFPGSTSARTPKGCQRVEITDIYSARKLESEVNHHERMKHEQSSERRERSFTPVKDHFRSELRQRMQGFSQMGQDLAREAMRQNDNKPKGSSFEPGFRIGILSDDRSNREAYRDKETNWQGRKG
jgi:hypothetical protein